jgi:4-amino-4-deoxy-L-arabinose transferase-like glycosyltransferase
MQLKPPQPCHGGVSSILQSLLEVREKGFSRAWLALLIFALALQMLSIWNIELSGRDSPRVAGIAREMAVTSNYLIPRLNGKNFLEYPPLGYWPIAFVLSTSKQPPDFLALLPLIFLGTGTVLLTFLIGRTLAGEQIGVMAGFILSTMPSFITLHRHCRVDPVLLFFTTLSLYGFATGYRKSSKNFPFFAIFYLAMAGAFLSKGIIGVAIPMATALVFLITRKDFRAIRKLLLSPGILLFLLPILLWVGSVWWLEGPGIFKEVIRESLRRFFSTSADHAEPFHYYFTRAFLYLMPWTLLPLVLLGFRWYPNHSREPLPHSFLLRFALDWTLTVFIGLSVASAKRPLYLSPIYPPFALLAALGWDRIRQKFPKVKRAEVYGLIVIFLVYIGACLLFIIPSEREDSVRPVFEAVSSRQIHGPVYLVNPSERLRGAAFFYLGEKTPVLNAKDLLLGRFEDRQGTTLVAESHCDDNQLLSYLRSKGYRLILRKKLGENCVCFYSNNS